MHMRTELASVLAAVLRYRSGTWTPRLKPAVRAACGGARERRLPRRAGGLAESCRLRFVGSCEVKVTVDIAEGSSSCIYTRSVRPSAHGRLKRRRTEPSNFSNLRLNHAAATLNRWLLSWLPTIQHRQQRRRHALVRRRRGSGATSQRGAPTTPASASVPAARCVLAERSQQQRQLRRRGRAALQGFRAHRERPVQLNSRVDGRAASPAQRAPPRKL